MPLTVQPVCSQPTPEEFRQLRDFIHRETGIFLKDSRRSLLSNRLGHCLSEAGVHTYREYYELLTRHDTGGEERRRMTNAITTNKTSFFRDAEQFEFLRTHLTGLLEKARPCPSLRIWSAASSTGEEPWSLAITVSEAMAAARCRTPAADIRILGSDIDTDVLATAERGIYSADAIGSVPDALRKRYFLRGEGAWQGYVQVKPTLRPLVTYRRINLVAESLPVRTRFDAIFCRNVMIYFDAPTQQRLLRNLLSLLKRGGLLFVGHSESLTALIRDVKPVAHAVYVHRDSDC